MKEEYVREYYEDLIETTVRELSYGWTCYVYTKLQLEQVLNEFNSKFISKLTIEDIEGFCFRITPEKILVDVHY